MPDSSQARFLEFAGVTSDESYESLAIRDKAILDAYDKGDESLGSIGMRHAITGEAVRLIAQRAGREPRSVVDQRRRDAAIEQAYVELKEGGLPDLKLIAKSHQTTVPKVTGRDPQLIGRIAERKNDLRAQSRESRLAGEGFRACRICHKTKPMNEFVIAGQHRGRPDRTRICKVCNRQRASEWHAANHPGALRWGGSLVFWPKGLIRFHRHQHNTSSETSLQPDRGDPHITKHMGGGSWWLGRR